MRVRRVAGFLLAAMLLTLPAYAAEAGEEETEDAETVYRETAEAVGTQALADGLPESAAEFLEGLSPTDSGDLGEGAAEIFTKAASESGGYLKNALSVMAVVLAVLLLCAAVRDLEPEGASAAQMAGALAVTAACTGNLNAMIGLGEQTLEDMTAFTGLLLPTMAAATAATGAAATSAAVYAVSMLFSDVLMTLITKLLLPLVYCYAAMAAAGAALGNSMLDRLGALLKNIVVSGLKGVLLVFTAYVSVSGIVSGSADAASVRAAKLALSAAVPVVGSILSDASETVLVSASLLKNSVGVFGMLAVLAICITPFLRIGVQYLALKAAAAVGGVLEGGSLSKLVEAMATAMGMVLAMTGSCALMLLISCVCSMKAVSG